MKYPHIRNAVGLYLMLVLSCGSGSKSPSIDQSKFEETYRAAKTLAVLTGVGVNYQKFEELLQDFATELSITGDQVASEEEKALLERYFEILSSFKDSQVLWQRKTRDASSEVVILNRDFQVIDQYEGQIIYKEDGSVTVADPVLSEIVQKYDLETQEKEYEFGGLRWGEKRVPETWVGIPPESIQIVWGVASQKLDEANKIYFSE